MPEYFWQNANRDTKPLTLFGGFFFFPVWRVSLASGLTGLLWVY